MHSSTEKFRLLIELNFVFFSILLVIYSSWRYFERRGRGLLYLTLSFTFLMLSTMLHMINSLIWIYGVSATITLTRLLELCGLAFFACFTITAVIALREISKTWPDFSECYSFFGWNSMHVWKGVQRMVSHKLRADKNPVESLLCARFVIFLERTRIFYR